MNIKQTWNHIHHNRIDKRLIIILEIGLIQFT